MPKTVTSPVEKFPGKVTLAEPLTMPMVLEFEKAIAEGLELKDARQSEYDMIMVPAICACVEEWNLEGLGDLNPDTFPGSPRKASAKLVSWLTREITALYRDAEDAPNV